MSRRRKRRVTRPADPDNESHEGTTGVPPTPGVLVGMEVPRDPAPPTRTEALIQALRSHQPKTRTASAVAGVNHE